ncbi:MAG: nicotinate (nicotinamide) nucleotide adenylyltransferase [Oscillospiraceae bacterium]
MKIGIFGGTFNPPHKGHEKLVSDFLQTLNLDKVMIIPNKKPTHKQCEDLAFDTDRLEMCRLAFKNPKYEISSIEIDRSTDSYMIFTIDEILEKYPSAELYLIIGADMFLIFHKWYKHREIIEKCKKICVATRDEEDTIKSLRSYAFEHFKIYIPELESDKILLSKAEPFIISSTNIREKIAKNELITDFVCDDVANYIVKRGLYGYTKK